MLRCGRVANKNLKLLASFVPFRSSTGDRSPDDDHEHLHLYRSKGQHILKNPRILHSIVQNSGVLPTDTVLEIGPGTGNLTLHLLRSASSVVAVEIDPRMVDILQRRVAESGLAGRLTVIRDDALKAQLPPFDLCVSNIPYNISSPLLSRLFLRPRGERRFRSATLLLQKEFARRLLAEPGESDFCRLAVNVRLVAAVELIMDVSKREFVPNPRVDSSLVRISPRSELPPVDLEEWWAFTLLCFGKKNKTLGAIFRQKKKVAELLDVEEDGTNIDLFKERIIRILRSGGFEDRRPSKLSQDELLHLLSLFNQDGISFRK